MTNMAWWHVEAIVHDGYLGILCISHSFAECMLFAVTYRGVHFPPSQWCILHISPYFHKMYLFPPISAKSTCTGCSWLHKSQHLFVWSSEYHIFFRVSLSPMTRSGHFLTDFLIRWCLLTLAVILVALPDNPYLLGEILKSELTDEADQLQKTEDLVRSQRLELEEDFKKLGNLKCLFSFISASLKEVCYFMLCILDSYT